MDEPLGNNLEKAEVVPKMSPRKALILSIMMVLVAYIGSVLFIGDDIFLAANNHPGKEHRAALVIQYVDTVFFLMGARTYTEPYLRKYYDSYWYFAQSDPRDCEEEFILALDKALTQYSSVDLYFLAHTNEYVDWIKKLPESKRAHLRLVYNTGCGNLEQGQEWLTLGADTFIGHPGVSFSVFFYCYFLRHWLHGASIDKSVDVANQRMHVKLLQVEFISRRIRNVYNISNMLFKKNTPTEGQIFDANAAMKESIASYMGNGALTLEVSP
jgi:ActR/RegA family two-component response regulator